ncbi:MAG: glycosyltransferase family 4 protein [Anaerolineae bacterium]|nr:glycosyltransferase family 4 protein [Anaerolineae bacterium]
MPRLLYLVNIPRFFVSHRLPLALAARDAGYDVHVATSNDDAVHVNTILKAGLPFHPLPLSQHGTNPQMEVATIRAIDRLYGQLEPDIVHQVTIKAILYGGMAARRHRVPAVVNAVSGLGSIFTTPGFKAALMRGGAKTAYQLALNHPNSYTIFQNPDDKALFVRSGLIAEARTRVIKGSGVDMDIFQPQPEPEGTPVVLFAGRLLWQKGVGEFVEAAKALRDADVQARFVIAGYSEPSSPDAVPPETLEAWQASGAIEWWGKREDMPTVFAQSHIVCLPSSYGEGVPKVLIEAAACGRPLVTTDSPGCREIAHHEDNGLLVPVGDGAALVAALRRLIENPTLRQQMGRRSRQIAEREFSLEHVCSATLALYTELLERRS